NEFITSSPPNLNSQIEILKLTLFVTLDLGYWLLKSKSNPRSGFNFLLGTRVEWLYYILQAFNSGDLVRYQELCVVHQAALSAQPALVQNERKLLQKINILCLMEIIFSRPAEDRTIPLSIIAERTRLSVEDVELLLMKSLSVSTPLVIGYIQMMQETARKIVKAVGGKVEDVDDEKEKEEKKKRNIRYTLGDCPS
ncbi:hypothetical protein MKW94_015621, partial [Papaver nudicaule]|nr:hypothetical protein [Papaver nudicaule]